MVALVGVSNLIVIDTPDALLVAHRDHAQQVGEVVKILEKQKRDDLL
jgi:mannose-1-phosphate guanylyltransferase